jgi:pilus assembly protein CpaC
MQNQHASWGIMLRHQVLSLLVIAVMLVQTAEAAQQSASSTVTVTVHKSTILRLRQKATKVSMTQPDIADVTVVSPDQILINGKAVGSTSLVVLDSQGNATHFDVVVVPDSFNLQGQLKSIFPNENIQVSTSGTSIVLRGEVSNDVVYDKVLEVAETYLPPVPPKALAPQNTSQSVTVTTPTLRLPQTGTAFAGGGQLAFVEETSLTDSSRWGNRRRIEGIIDMLVIREVQQIQLDVTVAEISLTKLRELGVDWHLVTNTTNTLFRSGSQAGFPSGGLDQQPGTFPPITTFGGGTSAIFSIVGSRFALTQVLRLFDNRDVTQILAQPRLVMKNGRSGGFLAGGEFPVPIATRDQIDVEFKPFGVRLDFVPTITWSKTIDLRVFPEVSEIDQSVSININNISIPGLKVRRSVNRVELAEGDTLIMGGLLDRRTIRDLTKIPWLGDIPIIGAMFRSTRYRDQETELVFVITPTIVRGQKEKPALPMPQRYDDPDMTQFPMLHDPGADIPKELH